jgi:hypothetical protein
MPRPAQPSPEGTARHPQPPTLGGTPSIEDEGHSTLTPGPFAAKKNASEWRRSGADSPVSLAAAVRDPESDLLPHQSEPAGTFAVSEVTAAA